MSDVDERGKLDALQQAETGRGLEFDAEEARLLDELLASADLTSPTPESRSGDRVSPAGTPHDLDQVPPEQSLQPLEDQVTVSRQDFGAPEPLAAFSAPPVESPPDAVGVLAAGNKAHCKAGPASRPRKRPSLEAMRSRSTWTVFPSARPTPPKATSQMRRPRPLGRRVKILPPSPPWLIQLKISHRLPRCTPSALPAGVLSSP